MHRGSGILYIFSVIMDNLLGFPWPSTGALSTGVVIVQVF